MIHPCCGFPLRNGAIILAIIDIIGSIFGTISSIITLICVTVQKGGDSPMTEDGSAGTFSITQRNQGITKLLDESSSAVYSVLGFVTLTCIVELILAMILLKGAKASDAAYCKIWLRTKLAIFLASTAVIVFAFVVSEDRLDFAVGGVFGIIYQIYGLVVIKAFINELEFNRDCEQKDDGTKKRSGRMVYTGKLVQIPEELPITVTVNSKYGDLYNKGVEYVRLAPSTTAAASPGSMKDEDSTSSNVGKTFVKRKESTSKAVEQLGVPFYKKTNTK